MELGYIGLGKMGLNMVERLTEKGYRVSAYDRDPEVRKNVARKGAKAADSLQDLVFSLTAPCLVWIMVPYKAVDAVLEELVPFLAQGDTIIDGGNSPYKESIRRAAELEARGIGFLDAGVSGGPSGARNGACIMAGGKQEIFRKFERLFRDLSVEGGYGYMGKAGAGHFVKMVHNGIEYGMMQALAEGFAVMKASGFDLDLAGIADLYDHRSVIESRLVGWLRTAYERHGKELAGISGSVAQSGEALWTIEAAQELGVPARVIRDALDFRIRSAESPSYTGKILSALRNEFGGHDASGRERTQDSAAKTPSVKENVKT